MADALVPGLDSVNLMGAVDGFTTALIYVAVIATAGFLIWLLTYWMSFKIKAQVEESVEGTTIVRFDKIRSFKDKTGVPKWQFWGSLFKLKKDKIDIPEHQFIKLTAKGKKFVNIIKSPAGEYVCVRSDPDKVTKFAEYDEFTTTERSNLVNELREADAYLPVDWSKMAYNIMMIMAPVIMITVFLIFFNNAVAPTISLGQQNVEIAKTQEEMQVKQQETIQLLTKVLEDLDPDYLRQLNEARLAAQKLNATNTKVPN